MTNPIALVTSQNARELSLEDDLLLDALKVLGVTVHYVNWDDPDYDWSLAGLVVVRTTWDYHYRLPEFSRWLDKVESVAAVLNPPPMLRWNWDKRYLLELQTSGVPIVPTLRISQETPLDEALLQIRAKGWGTIVIKPAVAAGAYETLVHSVDLLDLDGRSWTPVREHLERLQGHSVALVQPYIEGITIEGETSLVYFDGEFSHAVSKVPKSGDFRVQSEFGGVYSVTDPTPDQQKVAAKCLAALSDVPAFARVDLVSFGGTPTLMELELIEPELFLPYVPEAPLKLADILRQNLTEGLLS